MCQKEGPTIGLPDVVRGLEGARDNEAQHGEEIVHEWYVHLASMLHHNKEGLSSW